MSDLPDIETLRSVRLLPMAIVPCGYWLWCNGETVILASGPGRLIKHKPIGADTLGLSISDFMLATKRLAHAEAHKPSAAPNEGVLTLSVSDRVLQSWR